MPRNTADDFRLPTGDDDPLFAWAARSAPPATTEPAARARDPETSHQAAAGAREFAVAHRDRILAALEQGPASKTVLAARTGLDGVAVARRIKDLLDDGRIVVVSNDGVSPTGKAERVYSLAMNRTEGGR